MKINRICKSPHESKLLYRAISDFSPNGARDEYANWLAEQGDFERAKDLRKTIKAYQELDAKPLRRLSGSVDWQRMIGAPLLAKFAEGARSFDHDAMLEFRDLLFSKLKPALSLHYQPTITPPLIGSSRLWGLPDLAEGQDWPKIKSASNWNDALEQLPQDKHCAFLGQFSFADFNGTVLSQELPNEGGFSIFTITEVHDLGVMETVFMPWNNKADLVRRDAPPDLMTDELGGGTNKPLTAHIPVLDEVLSLPDATDGPFKDVIPNCKWNEPYSDFYYELLEQCGENQLGFGGYLRGTSGGDPSPNIHALRMAVLRTNPDVGVVHLAIPAEDLPSGRLDRVEYVWSDWDS